MSPASARARTADLWNITKGSLKNKLIILLPGALLLSWLLPSAILFILMAGGAYLSYEGAEKVMEKLGGQKHGLTVEDEIVDPVAFEKQRVSGAIRTDLILSAEIMAITLNEVAAEDFIVRAGVLAIVGIAVTLVVYVGGADREARRYRAATCRNPRRRRRRSASFSSTRCPTC